MIACLRGLENGEAIWHEQKDNFVPVCNFRGVNLVEAEFDRHGDFDLMLRVRAGRICE